MKEKAKKLLEELKSGKGCSTLFGESYYDDDINKIIEVATNECKSTVIYENGQSKSYESDIPIYQVREIIMQLLSDKNTLKHSLAGAIMKDSKRGIPGLVQELKLEKKVNDKGIPYIEVEKPFSDDFKQILCGDNNKEELLENVIKPYIATICKEDKELSKRHWFTKIFNKFSRKEMSNNELNKKYFDYLSKNTNLNDKQKENMNKYFVSYILENKNIIQELTQTELQGKSIDLVDGKKQKGYTGMINTMSNELFEILQTIENPNDKLKEVEKIYANLTGELEALSTDFNKEPKDIEEEIKKINKTLNRGRKEYYKENGYRNINVSFGKEDVGLLRKQYVPDAMKLYSEEVCELVKNADNMDEQEYIKEVAKLHFRFIQIHPFPDGNGRTGRAISNVILSKKNLCAVFNKAEKNEYINGLDFNRTSVNRMSENYAEALHTDPKLCNELEEKYVYKLEEFIGINLLGKDDLYKDRNITKVLSKEDKDIII